MPVTYGPNWHYIKPSEQPTTIECDICHKMVDVSTTHVENKKKRGIGNWYKLKICEDCHQEIERKKYSQTKHYDVPFSNADSPHELKKCSCCGDIKPVADFRCLRRHNDVGDYYYVTTKCKKCYNEAYSMHKAHNVEQPFKEEIKECSKCGQMLPIDSFYKTGDIYYMNTCKECYNQQSAITRRERIKKNPNYERERYMRKKAMKDG